MNVIYFSKSFPLSSHYVLKLHPSPPTIFNSVSFERLHNSPHYPLVFSFQFTFSPREPRLGRLNNNQSELIIWMFVPACFANVAGNERTSSHSRAEHAGNFLKRDGEQLIPTADQTQRLEA